MATGICSLQENGSESVMVQWHPAIEEETFNRMTEEQQKEYMEQMRYEALLFVGLSKGTV